MESKNSSNIPALLPKALRPVAAVWLVRVLAGGFMLAASTLFGVAVSADSPDSPAVEPSNSTTISAPEMSFPDVDDYDSLEYRGRLTPRTTKMEFPSVDDYDDLEYRGRG